MISQHQDPHHAAQDFNFFYFFLVLAPVLAAMLILGFSKLFNYLENRNSEERTRPRAKETGAPPDDEGT